MPTSTSAVNPPDAAAGADRPAPNPGWFVDARFGLFVHWSIYAIPARGEWVRHGERMSLADYQGYFEEFNPTRYDPRDWARLARQAGQRYIVLTTKHHDGFCLFDSDLTEYKATNTPAGRDLLTPFVEACREEGLGVGFYYSLLDWQHPHYPAANDAHHPMRGRDHDQEANRDFARYQQYLHGQVSELMSRYGKIDLLWLDFSYDDMSGETWQARELVDSIRQLQPDILINNRLVVGHTEVGGQTHEGLGDFATPEQIVPAEGVRDDDGRPVPWETALTLNDHWGYARDDKHFKSPRQVIRTLVECVAKGGNLLLNVGPTPLGEIQPECCDILQQVGQWMDRNGEAIHGCGHAEMPRPDWGYYTRKSDTVLYAHIFDRPSGPVVFEGLGNRIEKARYVFDGSEADLTPPWTVGDNRRDAFLNLPAHLPETLGTVVRLHLKG